MELSIIITSYKNPELLKSCLNSIQKTASGLDCELIVCDAETEESTRTMMKEFFPEIVFLSFEENVGFGELVRQGYAKSKGEYILILNSDMIMKESAIKKLLLFVKENTDVGLAGPQLLGFDGNLQQSCFRFYTPLTILYRRTPLGKTSFAKKHLDWFVMKDFDHKTTREVDWIMGSALMASRKNIEKVGMIDPRFWMYFEDTDWCRRFWEKDLKVVYYPDSQMYHYHGRGSAGKSVVKTLLFNKLAWAHIWSAIKYFWKYAGKPNPGLKRNS